MVYLMMNPDWEDHQQVLKCLQERGIEPTIIPTLDLDEAELVADGTRYCGLASVRRWLSRRFTEGECPK